MEQEQKVSISMDFLLQLEEMKLELLVIVYKNATVNKLPGLVHTARHAMGTYFAWKLKKPKIKSKLERSRNKVVVGEPVAGSYNHNEIYLLP